MENYKGYLIDTFSYQKDVLSYSDGRASAITSTTEWQTRVINATTGQTMKVRDDKEAKYIIDTWLSPEGTQRLVELKDKISEKEARIATLEAEYNTKLVSLSEEIQKEKQALTTMINSLPPRFI